MVNVKIPKVSIIILNWNGNENTKTCIKSLLTISFKNIEIIVVDNGSTDGSINFLRMLTFKNKLIRVVENKKNLGYAQGNNIGYKHARGKYILFLNNDTIVDKFFLEPLLAVLESDENIAAVQPLILNYPKIRIIDSIGSYFINSGFLYHFGHNKKTKAKYEKESEIFSMKGACMLIKKSMIDKIGLFDQEYFAYFEETDLCQRIWLAGGKINYIPQSKIYHMGGETAKQLKSSLIQYHSYKNRIYTYLKNFELITLVKLLPIHLIYCFIISIVYLLTFKFDLTFAILKAVFWNIVNIRKIYIKRLKINKLRKIHDNVYLPNLSRRVGLNYYYHLFSTSLAGYKE